MRSSSELWFSQNVPHVEIGWFLPWVVEKHELPIPNPTKAKINYLNLYNNTRQWKRTYWVIIIVCMGAASVPTMTGKFPSVRLMYPHYFRDHECTDIDKLSSAGNSPFPAEWRECGNRQAVFLLQVKISQIPQSETICNLGRISWEVLSWSVGTSNDKI